MATLIQIQSPPKRGQFRFALWDLGFRPFYLLASSFASLSILVWALQFSGLLPYAYLQGPMWHAHEMLFGFTLAVLALSDVNAYPAPLALQLQDFTQVQASVFQVARAPGKNVVYLGCLLLILGVFAMLYVRERRLWIWLAPQAEGNASGSHRGAASCVRR